MSYGEIASSAMPETFDVVFRGGGIKGIAFRRRPRPG